MGHTKLHNKRLYSFIGEKETSPFGQWLEFLSPLLVRCPELGGNRLFTLQSSLIIHRHSLSLSSLLSTSNTIVLFFSALFSPHASSALLNHTCLLLSFCHFPLSNLHPSILIPPSPLCGALLDKGGIPWPDCRKRRGQLGLD